IGENPETGLELLLLLVVQTPVHAEGASIQDLAEVGPLFPFLLRHRAEHAREGGIRRSRVTGLVRSETSHRLAPPPLSPAEVGGGARRVEATDLRQVSYQLSDHPAIPRDCRRGVGELVQ